MYCSRCGVDNREGAQFCEKCGTQLGAASSSFQQQAYQPPPHYAGQPGGIPMDPRMRGPVQVMQPAGSRYATDKNPAVALLLSIFLPAIGQIYNGDFKKCFVMWGAYLVSTVISVVTGGLGSLLFFCVWIWSVIDAYNVASRKSPQW